MRVCVKIISVGDMKSFQKSLGSGIESPVVVSKKRDVYPPDQQVFISSVLLCLIVLNIILGLTPVEVSFYMLDNIGIELRVLFRSPTRATITLNAKISESE